jgi:lysophospholipase L1-like esterase
MTAVIIFLGLLAALVTAAVALFTSGAIAAVIAFVIVLGIMVAGIMLVGAIKKLILAGLAILFIAMLGFGGFSGYQLYAALTDTSGPADPADPAALASAEAKLDAVADNAGFRIALTESELTAYMQDAIGDSDDSPIRSVSVDVVDGDNGDNGEVRFDVTFKGGGLSGNGAVSANLEAGAVSIEILDVSIGNLSLPGVATGAVEDIIETVLDLNETLAEAQADVQAIEIAGDQIVVIGAITGGDMITSADLLGALASNASAVAGAATPPSERLGPGSVNSTSANGASYYVALGDSLAANVGVSQASDGYVSRFHNQLQIADSASYGLRNFGVSGETSGSLIRTGQLDSALEFMRNNNIAFVTIDIGANDLLGHIGSADCESSFSSDGCQQRLANVLAAYEPNLERIFHDVLDAAPDAQVIFLQTYNPFSLGFGASVALEADSDDITQQLNAVAATAAAGHDEILIADGFSPMQGTTAATTHMLDASPDIHPKAIGYDILAGALVDALP